MSKRSHLFKVIILGNSSVGKTCLLQQYINKQFSMSYKTTVGADFFPKEVEVNGQSITLQIWDTAGQQRYRSLGGAFYKGSDCCVLVYDITNRDELQSWRDTFLQNCNSMNGDSIPFVIIGNKSDLHNNRAVSEQQGKQWQRKGKNILFFQTSAKQSTNVQKVFEAVCKLCLSCLNQQPQLIPQSVTLSKKPPREEKKKCKC